MEVEDPRSAPPLRWGILGAGGIAAKFAAAVRDGTSGEVVAVGSRDAERAARFAAAHGVPGAHASYEALVADPAVEAVYVATPHSEHRDHALLAIAAGRHVLVEKAFTRNEAEAREVLDAAARGRRVRHGGDVDPLPAPRGGAPPRARRGTDRRGGVAQRRPRAVVRVRRRAPPVRAGAGGGRAAGSRGVRGVVRPRFPGSARHHRGRRSAHGDRRGRPGQCRARVPRAHPGDGEHHPLGRDPQPRGDLRNRGPDRVGGPLLPRPVVHGHPAWRRALDVLAPARAEASSTRRPRWPGGWPRASGRARG